MAPRSRIRRTSVTFLIPLAALLAPALLPGQDRLRTMPRFERYERLRSEINRSVELGALSVTWAPDGKSFEYVQDAKRLRYDIAAKRTMPAPPGGYTNVRLAGRGPERGRQVASTLSPDSTRKAFYRDRNLYVSDTSGRNEFPITTDGSEAKRIKYGTASWVYGEELRQTTAMWWNPEGTRIAYYRFDESPVKDYYLGLSQTKVQDSLDTEAYPKAGAANPIVDLFVYDLATKTSTRVDVRDGKPFDNDVVGHYVYKVGWSPDGKWLTFNRTNRRQNVMEFTACDPSTGKCRAVVREQWLPSWTENHPIMQYLADNQRFVWGSERTGFRNLYLYDMSGKLLSTITKHGFEVASVVKVDEKAGVLYYMARDGDNHMKMQLHRVGLDGKNDKRLTDPAFHHIVTMSPDGKHFVDVAQTHARPPVTRLLDVNGTVVSELATSRTTKFDSLGLKPVELYTYKAADGVTELHGMLHKPSDFDPARKYPVLVTVYAGPGSNGARETFTLPHAYTELGFIVLSLDSRSASGRGKRFLDAIYGKLGTVEIDDQAAGVRALKSRPYVDLSRVGIFGTSYGGYVSALALLRHPDVFHAASAMSPVTDWRHYDTIYTERYMWIPQENTKGYDEGSAMKYVNALKGRLMLYFGTADNNVHPSNTLQLIAALQAANKSFEVQVGPDAGHTALRADRMMEFFIENLVLKPATALQP